MTQTINDNLIVTGTLKVQGFTWLETYGSVADGPGPDIGWYINRNTSGSNGQAALYAGATISEEATIYGYGVYTVMGTKAASFNVTNLAGFRAGDAVLGAGSSITNQYGIWIDDQTKGTNCYGLKLDISTGASKYNVYAGGTARNYFLGPLNVGTDAPPTNADSYFVGNQATNGIVGIKNINAASGNNLLVLALGANTQNTASTFIRGDQAGVASYFYVMGNGNMQNANNAYGGISDARMKTDVQRAGSQLNDVLALSKVVSKYRLKHDATGRQQLGLVAQDVQKISPGLVYEHTDGVSEETVLGLNYSVAYMKALKATGELIEIAQHQQAEIAALQKRLTALEKH